MSLIKSFLRKIKKKIIYLKLPNKDLIIKCNEYKILVRNPRTSLIGRSVYLKGTWEPKVTNFIVKKIKNKMNIIDVGADIGYYTLLFAKYVGPNGRIFSFEPIPKSKWYLDQNIKLNCLDNVNTYDFALFDNNGFATLEDPFNKSQINLKKRNLSSKDITVRMKIFDEWYYKSKIGIKIDLIKIDVEGAELNVLKGMKKIIQKFHPAILIEVHPKQIKDFGFQSSNIVDFLLKFNYKINPVDVDEIVFYNTNITLYCY